jgi:hypothetical protein
MILTDSNNLTDDGQSIRLSDMERARIDVHALMEVSSMNSKSIVQHGARILVAGELILVMLKHLPPVVRNDIARTFRERIENVLGIGDGRALPSDFQGELIAEVNRYLNALQQ